MAPGTGRFCVYSAVTKPQDDRTLAPESALLETTAMPAF